MRLQTGPQGRWFELMLFVWLHACTSIQTHVFVPRAVTAAGSTASTLGQVATHLLGLFVEVEAGGGLHARPACGPCHGLRPYVYTNGVLAWLPPGCLRMGFRALHRACMQQFTRADDIHGLVWEHHAAKLVNFGACSWPFLVQGYT